MSLDPQPVTNAASPSITEPFTPTVSPDQSPDLSLVSAPAQAPVSAEGSEPIADVDQKPIVARSGQYYRNTRYIMTAVTIFMGFWFLYDGFVRYPSENKKIAALKAQQDDAQAHFNQAKMAEIGTELKNHVAHSPTDLLVQRLLAFALPPIGILLLLWAIYNSRGEYRLSNDMLYVPGHPPLPLSAIRELDETLWDRKGIAYVRYTAEGNGSGTVSGRVRLDDFVYERTPTDQIVERIRKSLQGPAEAAVP